jgi:hypothetical protein
MQQSPVFPVKRFFASHLPASLDQFDFACQRIFGQKIGFKPDFVCDIYPPDIYVVVNA